MPEFGQNLEAKKRLALGIVGDVIGDFRALHITTTPGQSMIYLEKRREAAAFLKDASPVLADYPLIEAETGATAATAREVAKIVMAKYEGWKRIGAELEQVRMKAIASIKAAVDIAGVNSAMSDMWSTLSRRPDYSAYKAAPSKK